MFKGPFKTVTGKVEPVTVGTAQMMGPVLYYTDPVWMDVWTMACDCHGWTWFEKDIKAENTGRSLVCPMYQEVTS